MLNKEYYAKKIVETVTSEDNAQFAIDKHTKKLCKCICFCCVGCLFYDPNINCKILKNKWANSEHIKLIQLTKNQYDLLRLLKNNGYSYLAIEDNKIVFHWSNINIIEQYLGVKVINHDYKSTALIEDILNNCEVIENGNYGVPQDDEV